MSYTLFLFLPVHDNIAIFALLLQTSVPHLYLETIVDNVRNYGAQDN